MARLKERYNKEILPALVKHFEYDNVHRAPKLVKITVNMGVGEATQNKTVLDNAVKEMTQITGRKPIITKAKNPSQTSSCGKACP